MNSSILLNILKEPTGTTIKLSPRLATYFNSYGVDEEIKITTKTKLIAATLLLKENHNIEEILENTTWKDFESFIAEILNMHDYETVKNIRFRDKYSKKLFEIDVLAKAYQYVFAIDCKKWSHRSGKQSSLRDAALKQKKRVIALRHGMPTSEKGKIITKINSSKLRVYPMIVTWANEDIDIINGIPIVPISKFNDYILKFNEINDYLFSV